MFVLLEAVLEADGSAVSGSPCKKGEQDCPFILDGDSLPPHSWYPRMFPDSRQQPIRDLLPDLACPAEVRDVIRLWTNERFTAYSGQILAQTQVPEPRSLSPETYQIPTAQEIPVIDCLFPPRRNEPEIPLHEDPAASRIPRLINVSTSRNDEPCPPDARRTWAGLATHNSK